MGYGFDWAWSGLSLVFMSLGWAGLRILEPMTITVTNVSQKKRHFKQLSRSLKDMMLASKSTISLSGCVMLHTVFNTSPSECIMSPSENVIPSSGVVVPPQ